MPSSGSAFTAAVGFEPLEFDGALFGVVDRYKTDLLDKAHDLRMRVATSRELGSLLTGDIIAQGLRAIEAVDVRNQTPLFPPLFLTYLEDRYWAGRADHALQRLKTALSATPKVYRHFIGYARDQPMAGLFELCVYAALDERLSEVEPQPKLAGGRRKRADFRVGIDGIPVFIEATQ